MIALAYYAGGGSTASGACILGIASLGQGTRGCGPPLLASRTLWRSLSMGLARALSHVSIGQISGIA